MSDTDYHPTIGPDRRFYGYIIALALDPDWVEGDEPRLYATFEYNDAPTAWIVPDHELFALLARQLCDMACQRSEHAAYGESKLWIEMGESGWRVDLA